MHWSMLKLSNVYDRAPFTLSLFTNDRSHKFCTAGSLQVWTCLNIIQHAASYVIWLSHIEKISCWLFLILIIYYLIKWFISLFSLSSSILKAFHFPLLSRFSTLSKLKLSLIFLTNTFRTVLWFGLIFALNFLLWNFFIDIFFYFSNMRFPGRFRLTFYKWQLMKNYSFFCLTYLRKSYFSQSIFYVIIWSMDGL